MNTRNRKITVEFNEHDASRLLALVQREMSQTDQVWRPYWERQARNIQQGIQRASFKPCQHFVYSEDLLGQ